MTQLWIALILTSTLLQAGIGVRIVVRPGHPIHRAYNRTVIVRPPRRVIVTRAPIAFLPVVPFAATTISLPPRNRLVFEDSETIQRREGWVDSNFGVDSRGDALLLAIEGQARLDFAEVTFDNGQVQVVDFNERMERSGTFRLLDFADGRRVDNVRIVAKAESRQARLTVYLRK